MRSTPAKIRGSSRVWNSSSEVVITVRTAVSAHHLRRDVAVQALQADQHRARPESCSSSVSSRSRFIGLIDTAMPPAFQVPICAMTNCGTFCG